MTAAISYFQLGRKQYFQLPAVTPHLELAPLGPTSSSGGHLAAKPLRGSAELAARGSGNSGDGCC